MSDDQGLPALAVVMVIACAVLMFATNKFFGQPTFFSPDQHSDGNCSAPRGSSRSLDRKLLSDRSVFDDLPAFGVLEAISSFLSPADLVGITFVSKQFFRAATSEYLWKTHCETLERRHNPLGEAWRVDQQRRHGRNLQQEQEDEAQGISSARHALCCSSRSRTGSDQSDTHHHRWRRRRPRLSSSAQAAAATDSFLPGPDSSAVPCRWPAKARQKDDNEQRNNGSKDEALALWRTLSPTRTPSSGCNPLTGSRLATTAEEARRESLPTASCSGACCGHACYYYSWREAFFRAHRAKPRDLLEQLSCDRQQSLPSPPPQRQRCMVIVHGNVHDLSDFLPFHPGGALILQEHASTDATAAFDRFFHSREARRMAKRFVVWDGEAIMGRRGTLWKIAQRRYLDSSCYSRWQEGRHEGGEKCVAVATDQR